MPQPTFRLFRIPVRIDASFLFTAAILGWSVGRSPILIATWIGVVFVSILWHELGHAFAFRAFGHEPRIELHGMGGETSSTTPRPIGPGRDVLITLAGPGAGLALGVAVLLATRAGIAGGRPIVASVVGDLLWANIAWSVLNLIPMLPLDGGRVMAAVLNVATRGRGDRPALILSLVVAALIAVVAFVNQYWWGAFLVVLLSAGNIRALQGQRAVGREQRLEVRLEDAYAMLERRDLEGATRIGREVMASADTPGLRADSARMVMWAKLLEGHADEAVGVIEQAPLDGVHPLLHPSVLAVTGGQDRAVEHLRKAFQAKPGEASGTQLARGLIEAGRLDEALSLVTGPRRAEAGQASLLVARALYGAQRFDEAAALAERDFDRLPHPLLAYNAAAAWARAGDRERAVAWLGRAVDAGFEDGGRLEGDADFDAVRTTARYAQVRGRLSGGRQAVATAPAVGSVVTTPGYCYRHPDRPAALSCPRCRRPICRRDAIRTSAGRICPECVTELQGSVQRERTTRGVLALLGLNVAVFAAQALFPGLVESFGAVPEAIAHGEWYRLLTPMLLHAGIVHIGLNSYALWIYGPSAERGFGTLRFLALYIIPGFVGGATSYAFGPCRVIGVGASGAIFGLAAAVVVLVHTRSRTRPLSRLGGILAVVGLSLLLGFTIPGIDNFAHLGGFAGGLLLGEGLERTRRSPAAQVVIAFLVVALGVGLVAWRTMTFGC
ncbi:MAG: rhomboid family intramembrane serine protease [Actinomycetota bacterium]